MLNVYSAYAVIPFLQPSGKEKYYKDWVFFIWERIRKNGKHYFRLRYLSLPEQKRSMSSLRIEACTQHSIIKSFRNHHSPM